MFVFFRQFTQYLHSQSVVGLWHIWFRYSGNPIVGALLAGFLLTPLFGVGTINQNNFSLAALLISLLGAIILLVLVNLLRRGTVR